MSTTVVSVRDLAVRAAVKAGSAVYIGRAVPRLGLPASKWANPFRVGRDGDRAAVVAAYAVWLDEQDLDPTELRGQVLACWCAPLPCHGDVLASRANRAPGPPPWPQLSPLGREVIAVHVAAASAPGGERRG